MPFSKVGSKKEECKDDDNEEAIKQLLLEKTKRREVLRNQFLKEKSDPFKHASGEAGLVFDAAVQRYQALRVNHFPFFKPSFANACMAIFAMILPMATYGYLLYSSRTERERRFRSGMVPYKDRRAKLI